jgi:hypothetical protein
MSTTTLSAPSARVNVSPIVSDAELISLYSRQGCTGEITQEHCSELIQGVMASALAKAKTKQVQSGPLFCKIGEKGAVSVYGLNSPRFPVTLYAAQWERLAEFIPSVLDFIKQWDGKEYTGQAGTNGNKHQYRVTLARR